MAQRFESTRWSVVLRARAGEDPASDQALAELYEAYRGPLVAYVRGRGLDPEAADDLVQGYFLRFLEKRYLDDVDPTRGRFRAFLLASLKNFLANERAARRALKRGGPRPAVAPDDVSELASRIAGPAGSEDDPELRFERAWADTTLRRALARLERDLDREGASERWEVLRHHLTKADPTRTHAEAAEHLGISRGAVKVAVHRLRRRFGEALRREVADTVADPTDVDAELRHLLEVASGRQAWQGPSETRE